MSGFKGIMKDGWHPKGRDGKKEGWRNDFKGVNQVAGWMGKGKEKDDDRENHVSRPLASLKDPSSFGPPPKHIKYHGAGALPNETTPDRSGWGAPLSQEKINQQNRQRQEEEEEKKRKAEEAAKRPPVPYRANRTGIDTSNLPPPPVRRVPTGSSESVPASPRPKPNVPPRVPPRTNTSTPTASYSPSPPPAYTPSPPAEQPQAAADGYLNQAAASRLSQAGVSVPALGIGNKPSNPASPSTTGYVGQAPVNELQSRFSQLRTNSSPNTPPAPSPHLRQGEQPPASSTANVSNARSAYNDFRSKHNDQIEAGKQKLSGLNQKYGITNRINSALESKSENAEQAPPVPPHPNLSRSTTTSSTDTESLARRKAPPPPPPQKKAELRSTPVSAGSPAPPPLPLGTKPR
ncbi:hypothetical protein ASPCAL09217 [Aspergillus calidoustus]|uniref:Glyceraldehyde 3-phosphate dehydrogenase n=1 Tax=Aspergillus calidoustus TaxID=454130 RepID=A0A0U5HLT6_ASPCI|nr:hypothetical protein ASPCAL09217 [Aspergillus calidoustus]